uniref:Uncharacterized protein n=1 Tax=Timema cristinae TaxID=61476 RepID=A0A7R9HAT9_TIMCR|nr:unnamed protein product [Timema cristinae]
MHKMRVNRPIWTGLVASKTPERSLKVLFEGTSKTFRPLWPPRLRWNDDITKYLKELGAEQDWKEVTHDRTRWRRLVSGYEPTPLHSSHNRDSNLDLPVLGSLAHHETSTLTNYPNEADKPSHKVKKVTKYLEKREKKVLPLPRDSLDMNLENQG